MFRSGKFLVLGLLLTGCQAPLLTLAPYSGYGSSGYGASGYSTRTAGYSRSSASTSVSTSAVSLAGSRGDASPRCQMIHPLRTAQNVEIGQVTMAMEGRDLVVTLQTKGNWAISASQIDLAGSLADVPQSAGGTPQPDQFLKQSVQDDLATQVVYRFAWTNMPLDDFVVMSHIDAVQLDNDGNLLRTESAYGGNQDWSGGSSRAHYSIYTPCDLGAGSYDSDYTGYDTGVYDHAYSPYDSSYDSAGYGACGCATPPPPVDACGCDPTPVSYPPRPVRHQTWVQPIEIQIDFDLSWIWSSSTGHRARYHQDDCGCD